MSRETLKFRRNQQVRYWLAADETPVLQAVNDLSTDFSRTLAARLEKVSRPQEADLIIVNLQAADWPALAIRPNEWERYEIACAGYKLVIAGSDTRGLLFGIYQFCRHGLGVDPLYFWIPSSPPELEEVDAAEAVIVSGSPGFKYRGWFIDGEDLLEGWAYGKHREAADLHGVRHKTISYETYEKIFETMLRLRVNLIIPASVIDICEPESAEVFKRIRRRGLLFSQHHIEPVGVCPSYGFRSYCRKLGVEPEFSWSRNRRLVEDCWRHYIDKVADYQDSVIWQLGYRGAGDVPFWKSEADAPRDMAGRARIISGAIGRQYELIRERIGSNAHTVCTATLWWEGNVMYREGLLRLPPDVIPVISDVARTQMLPQPMPVRESGRRYGIYYHTSYLSTGPHMIQGNPPANVFSNYRRAIAEGAAHYSMQHVSNIRPFLPVIQAVAELTFDADGFNDEDYMGDFCRNHFGQRKAEGLYHSYFGAFVHRHEEDLQCQNARWLDGALVLMARQILELLGEHGGPTPEAYRFYMRRLAFRLQLLEDNSNPIVDLAGHEKPQNWLCDGWESLCRYAKPLLADSLKRWEQLIQDIEDSRQTLERGQALYDSNLHWQSLTGRTLTFVALKCFDAVNALLDGDKNASRNLFKEASHEVTRLLERARTLVEQEHFRGWMCGDRYLNLCSLEDRLRRASEANAGKDA